VATTIGRVEFLVGLDGNKLPAQARKLANQIAAAGTKGGKDFGDNFEASFQKRISSIGQNFADKLSAQGKLAARRFTDDFNDVVTDRFRKMQRNVAEILADKDTFREFASGFDTVDDAVRQLDLDLEALNKETYRTVDANGDLVEKNVLAWTTMRQMQKAARELGDELEPVIAREKDLARQTESLDADLRRLIRTAGDTDAFGKMAAEVGGTDVAFARLKSELEGTGAALGRSRGDIEEWVDSLDKTRDSVDRSTKNINRLEVSTQRLSRVWANLQKLNPFAALDKDVQLVIGLVASAAPQVAALGSAAGAALVAIGGAATSAVIGVVGLVSVFSDLNQEIGSAPAAMRPTIQSFNRFKETLGDVGDAISQAAFDEIDDAFYDLRGSVTALSPALQKVGSALGDLIDDFADGTKPGTAAFEEINEAILLAGPNLTRLGGIVGTFGTALIRAFNGAQPLVEDLFDWLDRLTNKFDAFTRSSGFEDWVGNAQRVWDAFGGTLDAVSQALNDLVTPQAIDNTVKLLENLERLAPSIGNLLEILGALDPLGLFVDILADIGETLAPLTPTMVGVAEALNDMVEAVPPGAWVAIAGGLMAIGSALAALKIAGAVSKGFGLLSGALEKVGISAGTAAASTGKLSGKLGALGKAGLIGAAVVGFVALTDAVADWARELAQIDGIVKNATHGQQSLIATIDKLSGAADGLSKPFKNADEAIAGLAKWNSGNIFDQFGAAMTETSSGAHDLNAALMELDKGMKDLPLEDQVENFSGWAKELGATDKQVLAMLDSMPEFKSALEDAAYAEDGVVESTDLVRLALGRAQPAAEGSLDAFVALTGGLEDGAGAAELQADALELLTGKSLAALDAVEGVADGITTLGSAFRDQQSASLDYEESIRAVNESLGQNGNAWAASTEAGAANQQAVLDLAAATLDLASEQYNLTGSSEEAAKSIQAGRDAVIAAVDGMDLGGLSAEEYADKLGLIPGDVETLISANTSAGMEMADAFATRLYELGLIEVNPVLALDAEEAAAQAAAIQAELDNLQISTYTTTLDANGDPMSYALEATATQLYGFENKVYKTTLDANGDPVGGVIDDTVSKLMGLEAKVTTTTLDANGDPAGAVLEDTANKMQTFADTTHTTKLDANGDPAGAVLESTANKMSTFGKQTFTPTLDVNNVPGTTKADATKKKLDAMDASTAVPKIDVNDSKAKDKTRATSDALEKLDAKTYTPDIDVDNHDAISGANAVKSSLDRLPTNKTITITTIHRSVTQDNRAAGGIASQATLSVWGEAGPEALVPLRRPLSQVDPAVRALSAVAQGKMSYGDYAGAGAGGGTPVSAGTSRVVNIESGAIVVQGSLAPEATATMTVNRIAERIGA